MMSSSDLKLAVFSCVLLMTVPQLISAQQVYLSETPGTCITELPYSGVTLRIYVNAPHIKSVTGATFRLDTEVFGREDVVNLTTGLGVVIEEGDMHSGIRLSWPFDTVLDQFVALEFNLEQHPPRPGLNAVSVFTRDVKLIQHGYEIPLVDNYTWANTGFACIGAVMFFPNPDTVTVARGQKSEFRMRFALGANGYASAEVKISDELGWTTSFAPDFIEGRGCVICQWDWREFRIVVDVPADVGARVVNMFTLEGVNAPIDVDRTFYVRAVDPEPIKVKSIGAIKSLYRR